MLEYTVPTGIKKSIINKATEVYNRAYQNRYGADRKQIETVESIRLYTEYSPIKPTDLCLQDYLMLSESHKLKINNLDFRHAEIRHSIKKLRNLKK